MICLRRLRNVLPLTFLKYPADSPVLRTSSDEQEEAANAVLASAKAERIRDVDSIFTIWIFAFLRMQPIFFDEVDISFDVVKVAVGPVRIPAPPPS